MKVHKYKITCYGGILDWTHRGGETQTRLYIPDLGVFAYRSKEQIDFFSDELKVLVEAGKCIQGESKIEGGVEYLGEIELPNDLIFKAIAVGKLLNQAKTIFEEAMRSLTDKIQG